MAYTTFTLLQDSIDLEALKSLGNDIDPTSLNEARITRIIEAVSDYIDDMLREVYDVPLTDPSGAIKTDCEDIVIWRLYKKRTSTPDDVKLAYVNAIEHLKALRKAELAKLEQGLKNENSIVLDTFEDVGDISAPALTRSKILTDNVLGDTS